MRLVAPALGLLPVVCVVLVGGCGGAHYTSYVSVEELRIDAVEAGLDCPQWTRDDRPDGTQAGSCSTISRLFVYVDGDALDSAMDEFHETAERTGLKFKVLRGENWVANDPYAESLQDALGGEIVTD
jgi:hypothetical protein